ncbi:hypothetical protein E3N88_28703 [Mikania micrantha]|uniref:Uncharacterized protein n=1 Tax=Mikania micrantha TaxID=192012 RepID=A0A5N6N356_9ASTR|nr:hypothetical protein E3N88_28703 [Mikania micrantha]
MEDMMRWMVEHMDGTSGVHVLVFPRQRHDQDPHWALNQDGGFDKGEWNIKNDLVLNYFRINISTQGNMQRHNEDL